MAVITTDALLFCGGSQLLFGIVAHESLAKIPRNYATRTRRERRITELPSLHACALAEGLYSPLYTPAQRTPFRLSREQTEHLGSHGGIGRRGAEKPAPWSGRSIPIQLINRGPPYARSSPAHVWRILASQVCKGPDPGADLSQAPGWLSGGVHIMMSRIARFLPKDPYHLI